MAPFASNHVKLIKDVYPPELTSADPLPSPASNQLGKLTFYAAGRPKKLSKVADVLLARAEKDGRASSGPKGRGGLAVTIDILNGLVVECRTELRCFAGQALRAVELGLMRREGQRRDPQMEARAASLVSRAGSVLRQAIADPPSHSSTPSLPSPRVRSSASTMRSANNTSSASPWSLPLLNLAQMIQCEWFLLLARLRR